MALDRSVSAQPSKGKRETKRRGLRQQNLDRFLGECDRWGFEFSGAWDELLMRARLRAEGGPYGEWPCEPKFLELLEGPIRTELDEEGERLQQDADDIADTYEYLDDRRHALGGGY